MKRVVVLLTLCAATGSRLRYGTTNADDAPSANQLRFSKSRNSTGRRVYLDLGANWMNSVRLFRDMDLGGEEAQTPWEIYAFEASPFIMPYCDHFTDFLNGNGSKPAVTVPPSGSSGHLAEYADRYGCGGRSLAETRECMFKVFKEPLGKLQPDEKLMKQSVVDERLAIASQPLRTGDKDRYVFVPAAAGGHDGKLTLSMMTPEQMLRGGAVSDDRHPGVKMTVPVVDIASWLVRAFKKEDFVVMKMDIEGAECELVSKLQQLGAEGLVDVLYSECHDSHCNCWDLDWKLKQMGIETRSGVGGIDSFSSPDKYYPVDPRPGH